MPIVSLMLQFAKTADRIASTTKKLEKTSLLANYFQSVPVAESAIAAVFFSGRPFPAWEETTLQVGGRLLWSVVAELSSKTDQELTAAYREFGDLGDVAGDVLPSPQQRDVGESCDVGPAGAVMQTSADHEASFSPTKVQSAFRNIAAVRGPAAKSALVRELLSAVSPLEAKYIVKIMTGDLRIGLKESLVEEAVAKAFANAGAEIKAVQRANMLLGDIGETLKLAASGRLSEAKMRLFHPIGFMLASPAESAQDALSYFQNAWVEDKYDGIRAQAHCSGDTVRFFSRTRDEITESFPELPDALAGLPQDAILDGEILAWSYLADLEESNEESSHGVRHPSSAVAGDNPVTAPEERTSLAQRGSAGKTERIERVPEGRHRSLATGRALPFSALQQRLGRKKVSEELMRDVPVAYLVFDVLYAGGELVIDRPLRERAGILDDLLAQGNPIPHGDAGAWRNSTRKFNVQAHLAFPSMVKSQSQSQEPRAESGLLTDDQRPATFPPTSNNQQLIAALPTALVIRAPFYTASSPTELNQLFDAAQARGNEGLMIKDPGSAYTPGRRGKSWLKLKRELATLDVVVTAVEYGHGRRIGVLSDYTFAVRDGDRLLNIGKAYSGLTDAEILEMTRWFVDHTIEDQGFRRIVEPKVVLEVAFNNMMRSERHSSGYALRFPRIVRLRPDKLPEEADTLETAKLIFDRQGGASARS